MEELSLTQAPDLLPQQSLFQGMGTGQGAGVPVLPLWLD